MKEQAANIVVSFSDLTGGRNKQLLIAAGLYAAEQLFVLVGPATAKYTEKFLLLDLLPWHPNRRRGICPSRCGLELSGINAGLQFRDGLFESVDIGAVVFFGAINLSTQVINIALQPGNVFFQSGQPAKRCIELLFVVLLGSVAFVFIPKGRYDAAQGASHGFEFATHNLEALQGRAVLGLCLGKSKSRERQNEYEGKKNYFF